MSARPPHEVLAGATATMSSVELVEVINENRAPGSAVLEHADFMKKVRSHPGFDAGKFSGIYLDGSNRKQPCFYLPKRECELMVMSESLKVQTRVYDRMVALEAGLSPASKPSPTQRSVGVDPALSAARRARAIASNAKTAASLCALFPSLGQAAQQTIHAKLINQAAGEDIVPLPQVEKLLGATQVGEIYGVSAHAVGALANANGLKIDLYGEFAMDQSRHSNKQMASFRYNPAGVAKIGELLGQKTKSEPPQHEQQPGLDFE